MVWHASPPGAGPPPPAPLENRYENRYEDRYGYTVNTSVRLHLVGRKLLGSVEVKNRYGVSVRLKRQSR